MNRLVLLHKLKYQQVGSDCKQVLMCESLFTLLLFNYEYFLPNLSDLLGGGIIGVNGNFDNELNL